MYVTRLLTNSNLIGALRDHYACAMFMRMLQWLQLLVYMASTV